MVHSSKRKLGATFERHATNLRFVSLVYACKNKQGHKIISQVTMLIDYYTCSVILRSGQLVTIRLCGITGGSVD